MKKLYLLISLDCEDDESYPLVTKAVDHMLQIGDLGGIMGRIEGVLVDNKDVVYKNTKHRGPRQDLDA